MTNKDKKHCRGSTVSIIYIESKRQYSDEWNKNHLTIDVSFIEYDRKHMSDIELIFLGDRPEASDGALAIIEYLYNYLTLLDNRKEKK